MKWGLHLQKQVLTIKLKELGVERGGDGFVVGIMLMDNMSNKPIEARKETCICLEVWVSQCLFNSYPFLWIKRLHNNQNQLRPRFLPSKPTKVFVKKSTANGFAFGNSCANGLRFRNGRARM